MYHNFLQFKGNSVGQIFLGFMRTVFLRAPPPQATFKFRINIYMNLWNLRLIF
jgi:hypothetical protein